MKAGADDLARFEDRILWEKVARTLIPMRGRKSLAIEAELAAEFKTVAKTDPVVIADAAPASHGQPKKPKPHPDRLDEPTHRKIAKGKLLLGGRIDLHGMTQGEAHGLLHSFLHRAHTNGLRHVLVITGKGSSLGSDGILRQAVPHWFATPPFRSLVGAYEFAHQSHGGAGAIYVRLRRNNEMRKA